jgi:hypothetical protein
MTLTNIYRKLKNSKAKKRKKYLAGYMGMLFPQAGC